MAEPQKGMSSSPEWLSMYARRQYPDPHDDRIADDGVCGGVRPMR
jgi:hypothetical protein